jgi:putative ABC transport system permease protein
MTNNIQHFVRILLRKKTISTITIGGYAISMAVIFILVSFIVNERSINKSFGNAENIYRIVRNDNESNVPQTFLNDAKGKIPGIEKIGLYSISPGLYTFENKQYLAKVLAANDDFFDIFSFDFISKTGNTNLESDFNIYLTQQFSEKLFGETNPVGKMLEINNDTYNIVAVISNPPKNSSFDFEFVTTLNKSVSYTGIGYNEEEHKMFNSFILLNNNADINNISPQIEGMISHWQAFKDQKLTLQPLLEVYFDTKKHDDLKHANVNMLLLLSGVAAIILLMTIFNYVNITVSTGYERYMEIGIRKATGASKKIIFSQFIAESLFISFISMFLSIIIVWLVSPYFSEVLGKQVDIFSLMAQPKIIGVGLIIFLSTGVLSGIYPAFAIARISPIQVINRTNMFKNRTNRGGIIAVQFFFTIVLITSLLFINKQIYFVKHKDLGFDKELIMRLSLEGRTPEKWQTIKEKLKANPEIASISATHGSPLAIYSSSSGSFNDSNEKMVEDVKVIGVDDDFIETFELSLIEGDNFIFSSNDVCIINEHLYKFLEWDDFNGKKVFGSSVVGIVKDFHHMNLYNKIGHLQLKKLNGNPSFLNIKMRGDISNIIHFIDNTIQEVEPGTPFNYKFYDDWVQSMYEKEEKQAYAIQLFSILAIIISCFGLIGIMNHITNRKIKEIGIRKVNGARISEVLVMLNKNFVKWVAIAFVISTPIAYFAMHKWQQNFAYKTELSWWIFALAGLLALGIALLTVSWQSWRAARRNPVESLRYE